MNYKLEDFDFKMSEDLIAQEPIKPRDSARLLILDKKSHEIKHDKFSAIINFLNKGDILVLNNSKVIPARLWGKKERTGGLIEVFLHKQISPSHWECLLRGRIREGINIEISKNLVASVIKDNNDGTFIVSFNKKGLEFFKIINKVGELPLPSYIKRKYDTKGDKKNYQTVYANDQKNGSVAAPTAGLHFTKRLLDKLQAKGVIIKYVTLHVGLGTFYPVRSSNILDHKMHSEYVEIDTDTIKSLKMAKKNSQKIIAVGTTSCRVLESWGSQGCPNTYSVWTDIFIHPGYEFKVISGLITNFHLPKSSLLILVSSLAGNELIKKAYQEAIDLKYRFFSYGDAMLIF